MLASDVDLGVYVSVEGYSGIAFWVDGWAQEIRNEYFFYVDEESGEPFDGWEEVVVDSNCVVECYMVGDDRMFKFDIQDLTKIDDDDFCGSCGQIGCGHG